MKSEEKQMKLKTYKFTKTLRELLDSSGVAEFDIHYNLYCPYGIAHRIPLTYDAKVYPFLINGNEIIVELTCPVCGRTHYRIVRFMASFNPNFQVKLTYLSSDVIDKVHKRELETFMGTSINTVLEDYRNTWTKYRKKYQENYSLYYSYKNKRPKEKAYSYLIQIPFDELSSTARQVLKMNSSYYPIEVLKLSLDMIEE